MVDLERLQRPGSGGSPPEERDQLVVVGIGASAGGLAALREFLQPIQADVDAAFVCVQHLHPAKESSLAQILAGCTDLTVRTVQDGERIQAGHVHVIPPNRSIVLTGGRLRLAAREYDRTPWHPVDTFLHALAEERGPRAVAVILSGTGRDGSDGARAVLDAGGMVLAQSPDSSEHAEMPSHAREAATPDRVAPPAELARELLAALDAGGGGRRRTEELLRILAIVEREVEHDFSGYRHGTLSRRIHRRLQMRGLDSLFAYRELLERTPEEVRALFDDLLIGVTSFFRDAGSLKSLVATLLEQIGDQNLEAPLRLWVPACSTGEEVYSLAMLLDDALQRRAAHSHGFLIFGTDIDRGALEAARRGEYSVESVTPVPTAFRERYFEPVGGRHRVVRRLRGCVLFSAHDLVQDTPFSRLDAVSCRNFLIYLEGPAQRRALELVHFSLRPDGLLLLGPSEGLAGLEDLFAASPRGERVFRRIGSTRPGRVRLPAFDAPRRREAPREPTARNLERLGSRLLIEQYAPPGVLVDRRHRIVHFFGRTAPFLVDPSGRPSLDLRTRVRRELQSKARVALREAISQGETVRTSPASMTIDGEKKRVTLSARPLSEPPALEGMLLITFETDDGETPSSPASSLEDESLVSQLEAELESTREELHTMIGELEGSNEELQATNEEALLVNEELETSREELQSLNEELATVNAQLVEKIDELERSGDDLMNVLASTDLAVVFLDRELRVRRFTHASTGFFRLIEDDVGRAITDIVPRFEDPDLLADAAQTLESDQPTEREVAGPEGETYLRRLGTYRTQEGEAEGLLLTFSEVTRIKRASEELERLNATLEQEVERRTSLVQLLFEVTAEAREAADFRDCLARTVRRICERTPFSVGHAFRRNGSRLMTDSEVWYYRTPEDRERARALVARSSEVDFPDDTGLIGRAASSHEPEWLNDLSDPARFVRQTPDLEFSTAVAIPIYHDGEVLAVLDLFSVEPLEPDEELLGVLRKIGEELGNIEYRRRAEELQARLVAIVDSCADAILSKSLEGIIASWNGGAEAIYGYTADEIVGRSVKTLVPPELHWQVDESLRCVREGRTFRLEETTRVTKDGRRIPISLAVSPILDGSGTLIGASSIARDLSQQVADRQRQEVLETRVREAEKLESLGAIAGGIAHDFNNLLTAILGHAELASELAGGGADELGGHLDLIQRAALASADLCNQLLSSSREEPAQLLPVAVRDLFLESEEILRATLPDGVTLDILCAPELPPVEMDLAQFRRVLVNLVANAGEAYGRGPGHVTVSVELESFDDAALREAPLHCDLPAGDYVVFAVRDDGGGLDPQAFARVFEPFFTTKFAGRGLGLTTVLSIVRAHGGGVKVAGEVGQGACFRVLLPPSTREPIEIGAAPEHPTHLKGSGHVLLVDDEPVVRRVAAELLRAFGFEVNACADGHAAIEALRAAPDLYRFALVDLLMPGMKGDELMVHLTRVQPKLPVVLMSGFSDDAHVAQALERGWAGFLAKPFTSEALARTVNTVLDTACGDV